MMCVIKCETEKIFHEYCEKFFNKGVFFFPDLPTCERISALSMEVFKSLIFNNTIDVYLKHEIGTNKLNWIVGKCNFDIELHNIYEIDMVIDATKMNLL